MIFLQKLQIHTRFIIKSFHKSLGNDLHQIAVTLVVLCQKNQMVITVFSTSCFTVKAGSRCNINFTAQDRIDSRSSCRTVKIDHAVHHTMVRNSRTVHAKFFDTVHIFFYFIRTIQKTVFCMDMKMCKVHTLILYLLFHQIDPAVFDLNFSFFKKMSDCTLKCIFA